MALPIIPIVAKLLLIKLYKGAAVGIARYIIRIFRRKNEDSSEVPRVGMDHIQHVVKNEWKKRDNLIFLVLMLSSAIYGLQELLVWGWQKIAKRLFPVFNAGEPVDLEIIDDFIARIHAHPWRIIIPAMGRWILTASLFYWPDSKKELAIESGSDDDWVFIIRRRRKYYLRIDKPLSTRYNDMQIDVNEQRNIEITLDNGNVVSYERNYSSQG